MPGFFVSLTLLASNSDQIELVCYGKVILGRKVESTAGRIKEGGDEEGSQNSDDTKTGELEIRQREDAEITAVEKEIEKSISALFKTDPKIGQNRSTVIVDKLSAAMKRRHLPSLLEGALAKSSEPMPLREGLSRSVSVGSSNLDSGSSPPSSSSEMLSTSPKLRPSMSPRSRTSPKLSPRIMKAPLAFITRHRSDDLPELPLSAPSFGAEYPGNIPSLPAPANSTSTSNGAANIEEIELSPLHYVPGGVIKEYLGSPFPCTLSVNRGVWKPTSFIA